MVSFNPAKVPNGDNVTPKILLKSQLGNVKLDSNMEEVQIEYSDLDSDDEKKNDGNK